MINAVITSKDPYLLARMATDIQLHTGVEFDSQKNTPFSGNMVLHTWKNYGDFLINPMFDNNPSRFVIVKYTQRLTESNYLSVLTKILES